MKQLRLVVLVIIALSLWSVPAYSQPSFEVALPAPGMPFMGDGPGMMLPLLLKGVELTPAQETQVKDLMAAQRESLRTLFQQLRAAHEEMANKLFTPGDVKTEDLAPQMQRITQIREQLMKDGLNVMLEVRKILTAEQLAKAAQIKERMQALHEEMRSLLHDKGSGAKTAESEEGDVIFFHHP
jgi:periplasmic protein CpxP/Spy